MASYRNSYSNYYSDKTGNHSPVGSILPVFADVNLATNEPEYTYPQHLYCDGKELNIRDYPELYSIIQNTYGGSTSVNKTQSAQPGGLRRAWIQNDKMFMNFYYDSTNNKANVKRPYPYGAVFRFSTITNPWGSFPSAGVFNQSTFYGLQQPTEDVTGTGDFTNEFTYEVAFPDTVDLSALTNLEKANYFILFGGSTSQFWGGATITNGTHPDIVVQKSYVLQDYPYNVGTFNLPDYRQRKILGFGNVNGAGTATPENAVNNFVGQTGGQWYIPKNTLVDSGEFFVIGDVKTTGYNNIVADIPAYVTGSVKYQIGPMDDYTFPFPPDHGHRILSVEVDATKQAERGAAEVDKFAVDYIDSRANISIFEPNGTAGGALGHAHGLIGVPLQNSLSATYGNSNGIGDTLGTSGGQQYQYLVSESAEVIVTAMTYDSNTDLIIVNTDGNHNFSVNDIVTINGASPSEYSGNFTIGVDGFSLTAFSVPPRDGETPGQATASGSSITVKLANGYFAESEVVVPPRAYVIDATTLVGGKEIQFEVPGQTTTIKEANFTTPQAGLVTIPDAGQGTISGCIIQIQAPGGGGADSDTDGQNGGFAEIGLTVDGTFYTIRANGGGGGTAGQASGAGGSGGGFVIPQALLDDARFSFTLGTGADGESGGTTGTGFNDTEGGGQAGGIPEGTVTTGGDGTAQVKQQTNSTPQQTFTSDGSWIIPTAAAGEVSRTIAIEISGGGGGSGNANANSNCTGQWPGWPQALSGKTGALGGYAGRGARVQGSITAQSGTITFGIGQGGNVGFNRRSGDNNQGTTGNDPATGQPWGPPFPGGVGTGTEPDGSSAGVSGAAGTLSGNGGRGAWGNGATGGSGGGVTGIYLDGTLIAGAGGGGGGGGSGGGYNGGGTTDGCYPGGDAQGPTESLKAVSGVLDFASGGAGGQGGCSAGGGGGGGSACGIINVTPGGVGGQAGVGHNGNGGGTGGREGISAYRTDFWQGGVTADSNGALPTEAGYVKIQYSSINEYYDNVGGAGGQGGDLYIGFNQVITDVTVNLQSAGLSGGTAKNGAEGRIYVSYFAQDEGTQVPGGTTNPTGRYYECDSDGNPIGASFQANVWLSSTDNNIKPRGFGTGSGTIDGFIGGASAIPNNTSQKIQQYIPFTGNANDAVGKRQLEVGTFALDGANKMRFTVIRGSNQNGGENPDQALNVFYKKGTSNNVTLFSQILLASNADPGWQTVELDIPEGDAIRDPSVTLILEQDRGPVYQTAPAFDDNYGLGAITFFYDSTLVTTFISTGGATVQGNLDSGGQPINSDDGVDQVRREVTAVGAALTVSDGTFSMSSSTPITTTSVVTAENDIPLITKYHRVKYLIKAL
ncbi:MAG: hypothetical protein CMC78_02250 [Flavobacteriaceae bacterium]|nr:hypothetical protein [Flavobacteriaceae bacterium]|tara:strand:- start:1850 stop:5926 length:4077 start_codon:yes stop_codon:yes gene_type:complete